MEHAGVLKASYVANSVWATGSMQRHYNKTKSTFGNHLNLCGLAYSHRILNFSYCEIMHVYREPKQARNNAKFSLNHLVLQSSPSLSSSQNHNCASRSLEIPFLPAAWAESDRVFSPSEMLKRNQPADWLLPCATSCLLLASVMVPQCLVER